jgi:hypothetical protein
MGRKREEIVSLFVVVSSTAQFPPRYHPVAGACYRAFQLLQLFALLYRKAYIHPV